MKGTLIAPLPESADKRIEAIKGAKPLCDSDY